MTKKTISKIKVSGDVQLVSLADFIENPDNPQTIEEREFAKLVKSVKSFPQMLAVRQIAYITDAPESNGKCVVLGGNKRLRALKQIHGDDGRVPAEWFADITNLDAEQRREFLVKDNVQAGEWDAEKLLAQFNDKELDGWGVDVHALMVEMTAKQEAEEAAAADAQEKTDLAAASLDKLNLDARMQAAKYVFFAFSGGRDSTRAIYLTAKKFIETGKRCEAVYIENPCEYPDLICHIRRVCAEVGLPLHCVHPDGNYLSEYVARGKAPDSIFMDCVEKLINAPMDKYIESIVGNEDYILVRCGQAKQKTSRSHTAQRQVVKAKPNMIIYNPLFCATEEQLAVKIPEWAGYAAGFKRTACWCCPFQQEEQFRALKANYPLLYEELKKIVASMKFKYHEGDKTTQKKFRYWEREEGIKVKWY